MARITTKTSAAATEFPLCTSRTLSLLLLFFALASKGAIAAGLDTSLPDAKAFVGKLFVYTIPETAFPTSSDLQVTEANHESLPRWLYYSGSSRTVAGIAATDDKGVYIISVHRVGALSGDVFAVTVVEDENTAADRPVFVASAIAKDDEFSTAVCKPRKPVTMANVVIDANLDQLGGRERVHLLRSVAAYLGLSSILGLDLRSASTGPLTHEADTFVTTTLVAGPGNALTALAPPGVVVSWVVGCGAVSDMHLLILERLEVSAQDGTMAHTILHDIIGWSVSNRQLAADNRRLGRRQAPSVTATSVPDHPPPTRPAVEGNLSRTVVVVSSAIVSQPSSTAATLPVRPTSVVSIQPTVVPGIKSSTAAFVITTPPLPPPFPVMSSVHEPPYASTTKHPTVESTERLRTPTLPDGRSALAPTTSTHRPTVAMPPAILPSTNLPPQVLEELPEQRVHVGQLHSFEIPDETFYDEEDSSSTSQLQLTILSPNGERLTSDGWLTFDRQHLLVTMLPEANAVGRHAFVVEAQDKDGAVARAKLVVDVLPTSDVTTTATQRYSLTIDIDYDTFMANRRESIAQLALALQTLHGGRRVVITSVERGSVIVSYVLLPVDESAAVTTDNARCDKLTVRLDNSRVFNEDGSVRRDALSSLPFPVSSLRATPQGPCDGMLPSVGGPMVVTTKPPPLATPYELLALTVPVELGKELHYDIPRDTFANGVAMRNLSLRLLKDAGSYEDPVMEGSSWIRLHSPRHGSGSRFLYGLLLRREDAAVPYVLRATDNGGHEVAATIRFSVSNDSVRLLSHAVSVVVLTLDEALGEGSLAGNVDEQLRLIKLVASVNGDSDTRHIAVLSIGAGVAARTTDVTYMNTSSMIDARACMEANMLSYVTHVAKGNRVLSTFVKALRPFAVHSFELKPFTACPDAGVKSIKATVLATHSGSVAPPAGRDVGADREAKPMDDGDSLLGVVLPVVVVVVLLVVAVIVAAILVLRRRRRARMNISGGAAGNCLKGKGSAINKGIPVIFDEELEDGGGCTMPLVQSEVKVIPPPDYPGESTPLVGNKEGSTTLPDDGGISLAAEQRQPLLPAEVATDDRNGTHVNDADTSPPYQPPTPPLSEPDESSSFPRSSTGNGYNRTPPAFVPP